MTLEVRRARREDRLPLARMLELYQHDLSDVWDQDLDVHGEYGYPLDRYFVRPECHAFIATWEQRYAGFALVDAAVRVGRTGHWMDQFFILRKYRRRGLGRALAHAVLAQLPGTWEVGQTDGNDAARAFWRQVIAECAHAGYAEQELRKEAWTGWVQCFEVQGSHETVHISSTIMEQSR